MVRLLGLPKPPDLTSVEDGGMGGGAAVIGEVGRGWGGVGEHWRGLVGRLDVVGEVCLACGV